MPFVNLFKGHDPHFASSHHSGYWDFVKVHPHLQPFTKAMDVQKPESTATINGHLSPLHGNGHVRLDYMGHDDGRHTLSVTSQHEGRTKFSHYPLSAEAAGRIRALAGY